MQLLPTLPFPERSRFTLEDARQINAIPNEEIKYSQAEVDLLNRALENIDYMIQHTEKLGLDSAATVERRKEVEEHREIALKNLEKSAQAG